MTPPQSLHHNNHYCHNKCEITSSWRIGLVGGRMHCLVPHPKPFLRTKITSLTWWEGAQPDWQKDIRSRERFKIWRYIYVECHYANCGEQILTRQVFISDGYLIFGISSNLMVYIVVKMGFLKKITNKNWSSSEYIGSKMICKCWRSKFLLFYSSP